MPPSSRAVVAAKRGGAMDVPVALGALTGGLLASSCCVVQLVLNSLSVGCAGLSVFKQYRGLLRLATAGLLGLMFARAGVNRRTLGTLVCSLLLTFSEDMVAAVNRAGSIRALLAPVPPAAGSGDAAATAAAAAAAAAATAAATAAVPKPHSLVRWSIGVKGMRCQACAARVRGSVAALPGVVNATVKLDKGRVVVWADASSSSSPSSSSLSAGAGALSGPALVSAISALDPSYAVSVAGRSCHDAASGAAVACADEPGQQHGQQAQDQQQQQQGGASSEAPMACGGELYPDKDQGDEEGEL
jgi:copper chaperone CopZ